MAAFVLRKKDCYQCRSSVQPFSDISNSISVPKKSFKMLVNFFKNKEKFSLKDAGGGLRVCAVRV